MRRNPIPQPPPPQRFREVAREVTGRFYRSDDQRTEPYNPYARRDLGSTYNTGMRSTGGNAMASQPPISRPQERDVEAGDPELPTYCEAFILGNLMSRLTDLQMPIHHYLYYLQPSSSRPFWVAIGRLIKAPIHSLRRWQMVQSLRSTRHNGRWRVDVHALRFVLLALYRITYFDRIVYHVWARTLI